MMPIDTKGDEQTRREGMCFDLEGEKVATYNEVYESMRL